MVTPSSDPEVGSEAADASRGSGAHHAEEPAETTNTEGPVNASGTAGKSDGEPMGSCEESPASSRRTEASDGDVGGRDETKVGSPAGASSDSLRYVPLASQDPGEAIVTEKGDSALLGDSKALMHINQRRTTDCCWGVLFLAYWVFNFSITVDSFRNGDPRRLFGVFDYRGKLCGVDDDVAELPYGYWPRSSETNYPICVGECPVDSLSMVPFPVERAETVRIDSNNTLITVIVRSEEKVKTYNTKLVAGLLCLPAGDALAVLFGDNVSDPQQHASSAGPELGADAAKPIHATAERLLSREPQENISAVSTTRFSTSPHTILTSPTASDASEASVAGAPASRSTTKGTSSVWGLKSDKSAASNQVPTTTRDDLSTTISAKLLTDATSLSTSVTAPVESTSSSALAPVVESVAGSAAAAATDRAFAKIFAAGSALRSADGEGHQTSRTDEQSVIRSEVQSGAILMVHGVFGVFKDIADAWLVLVVVLLVSIGLGFGYLFFLRKCARIVTWGLIGGVLLVCLCAAPYLLFVVASSEQKSRQMFHGFAGSQSTMGVRVAGLVVGGFALMIFAALCVFWMTIRRALGCLEASCEAIWALPRMLLMPAIEMACKSVFIICWLVFFAWILSTGNIDAPAAEVHGLPVTGLVHKFTYSWAQRGRIAANIVFLWLGLEVISMIFHFLLAYAVVVWYFTPCREDFSKPEVSQNVWERGIRLAVRYHFGSLVLAGAVIGAARTVSLVLAFIAKQAKNDNNRVQEIVSHMFMCCIWCNEEIMRYMTKSAIIELVLKSTDFFTSAGAAIRRLSFAGPEVAGLNGITEVFQFIGNITTVLLGSCLALVFMSQCSLYADPSSNTFIEWPMIVVVAGAMIALSVSSSFMTIVDITSDTLLFCWLTDVDDGNDEFAPAPLRNLIGQPQRGPPAAL